MLTISYISSDLSANIIDSHSAIDLTLYTSENLYTCPSDGYVCLRCNGNQSGHFATLFVLTNKNDYAMARCQGDLSSADAKIIYVKRGMKIYGNVSSTSHSAVTYCPFA